MCQYLCLKSVELGVVIVMIYCLKSVELGVVIVMIYCLKVDALTVRLHN
ncbi:hypothetical protein [Staphylococcus aureus]